jgi:hypothetical protein
MTHERVQRVLIRKYLSQSAYLAKHHKFIQIIFIYLRHNLCARVFLQVNIHFKTKSACMYVHTRTTLRGVLRFIPF